ncbi:MAG: hypothetical protein ACTTKL_00555 [Treponema sp.]
MKKEVFEFIKKADYVLAFVLAVLGIAATAATIVRDLLPFHRAKPHQVAVVEDAAAEIKEYVEFETKIKDAYVFSVKSSAVKADGEYGAGKAEWSGMGFSNALGKSYSGDGVTNFIFVKAGEKEEYKLFPSNVFIYKYYLAEVGDERRQDRPRGCNVYAVGKSDTTGDKILSSEDDIALYVSDYDGKNVKEISSSIMTFQFLGGDEALFSEYDGEVRSYFAFGCKTGIKTLIKSVKETLEEKKIALY